jgi:peptide/nickel transport system permease protein
MLIALPLGILAAQQRGRAADIGASIASLVGVSIPSFVTATILILVVALGLHWVPPGGYVPLWDKPIQNLQLMILPAISLGVVSSSLLMRIFRVSMIDALGREYVQAARARGADEWRILGVHTFRNASIPLITVGAMEVAAIFGGSVIVEKIFQLPGIGSYVLMGIESRDFGLLQSAALIITAFVLLANLSVDLIAAWLDPRLRGFA